MVSNWFNILKIKTPDGKMMVVENIQEFHDKFRQYMRPVVLPELRLTSERLTEATKINIKPYPEPNGIRYNASWRDANDEKTYSLDIKYKGSGNEEDPHELISMFSDNLGPSLILGTHFEAEDPIELLLEVRERVAEFLAPKQKKVSMGIPSIEEEEGRKTQEQLAQELARENPGYQMVEGQMRDLGDMKRLASRRGISLEQLLARHNLTVADFMVNLPQETNTPPPPPRPEVPDVGAQKRENLRMNRQRAGPIRRKRPPKEEEQ